MNRIIPLILAVAVILTLIGQQVRTKQADLREVGSKRDALKRDTAALNGEIAEQNKLYAATCEGIARGRPFMDAWKAAHNRSVKTSVDSKLQELASANELIIPVPRVDPARPYIDNETTKLESRSALVTADGRLPGQLVFLRQIEQTFPLALIETVVIQPSQRDPRMEVAFQVFNRTFAVLPANLEEFNVKPETTGVYSRRPRDFRTPVPELSDTLLARTGKPSQRATEADDSATILSSIVVTGLLWDSRPAGRRLMMNGTTLRIGDHVPKGAINGAFVVTVHDIGKEMAIFNIEKQEYNPVTRQTDRNDVRKEVSFRIFDDESSDGTATIRTARPAASPAPKAAKKSAKK